MLCATDLNQIYYLIAHKNLRLAIPPPFNQDCQVFGTQTAVSFALLSSAHSNKSHGAFQALVSDQFQSGICIHWRHHGGKRKKTVTPCRCPHLSIDTNLPVLVYQWAVSSFLVSCTQFYYIYFKCGTNLLLIFLQFIWSLSLIKIKNHRHTMFKTWL